MALMHASRDPRCPVLMNLMKDLKKHCKNEDFVEMQRDRALKMILKELEAMDLTFQLVRHAQARVVVRQVLDKCTTSRTVITKCKALLEKWDKMLNNQEDKENIIPSTSKKNAAASSPSLKRPLDGGLSECVKRKKFAPTVPPCARRKEPLDMSRTENQPSTSVQIGYKEPSHVMAPATSDKQLRGLAKKQLREALVLNNDELVRLKKERQRGRAHVNQDELADAIERQIFKSVPGIKYKRMIQSKVFNLRQNDELRFQVVKGSITAEQFVQMTTEEMANNDLKAWRERAQDDEKKALEALAKPIVSKGFIKCPKCKSDSVDYNQLQILSGDEPMTTCCYCHSCGNRWKFN